MQLLLKKKQLYGKVRGNRYVPIKFIDLVCESETPNQYCLVFTTDEEISGKTFHMVELIDNVIMEVYDYDKSYIDKLKNDMKNLNRTAIDYGYESIEDFFNQYNKQLEELPERMLWK